MRLAKHSYVALRGDENMINLKTKKLYNKNCCGSGHSLCFLDFGRDDGGRGDDGTEWSREKSKSVSISQHMLLAKRARTNRGAHAPSHHCILELLNSLCSHGLGMHQLITQTECEQTGCAPHLRSL